jgi:septal ring factor EnvC (AmiA/AmiB activator)
MNFNFIEIFFNMSEQSIWTAIITALTVLGSTSAWRFYENRARRKEKEDSYMRDECRERIARLEALLVESSKEKDEMRNTILKLTEKVAELTVKVEFLQRENTELLQRISG